MRLLIVGCSARKNHEVVPLPALERYDGPAFRTLRAYLRTHPQANLTIMVVSAHYGLVRGTAAIPYYDQRMTAEAAARLRSQVRRALAEQVYDIERFDNSVSHTLIMLGATYRSALPPDATWMEPLGTVAFTDGGIGRQLGQLKRWLHATESIHAHRRKRPALVGVPLCRTNRASIASALYQHWHTAAVWTKIQALLAMETPDGNV